MCGAVSVALLCAVLLAWCCCVWCFQQEDTRVHSSSVNSPGERQKRPTTVPFERILTMSKPRSVRPKYGSTEWTAQMGVAPIKRSGFGVSSSRNMTLIRTVVEAPSDSGKVY